jgi:exosortase/archaeosortase family protein
MIAILALEAIAFWPVWIWWARRIAAEPEAGWGLAALATAVWFATRKPRAGSSSMCSSFPTVATAMVLAYSAVCCAATPIFRAAAAIVAIGITLAWPRPTCSTAGGVAIVGLCVVALPITASLQFVAGFPMRLAASTIASWLLRATGAAVAAEGTGLRWSGGLVEVDVPCSGIRMLWGGLYLALASACAYRTGIWRTCGVVAAGIAAVIAGNALRTAGLFYLESGLLAVSGNASTALHTGAGLIVFAGITAVTVTCARS